MLIGELDGQKFIDLGHKFINIHEEEKLTTENLNFRECRLSKGNKCGTVACHGGWGIVIFKLAQEYHDAEGSFIDGAEAIAEYLGFKTSEDFGSSSEDVFALWADDHPEIWGNAYGAEMFAFKGYLAFGKELDEECTLKDIGDHYIAVGARILELNKSERLWTILV